MSPVPPPRPPRWYTIPVRVGLVTFISTLLSFAVSLLLAIALVAVLGPSLTNVVLALSLIGWVGYARLVRGQVLRTRELEFVQAARALGATTPRIPSALPRLPDSPECGHSHECPCWRIQLLRRP